MSFKRLGQLLIDLDIIDGYCLPNEEKPSSKKKNTTSSQRLASVFPNNETMTQVLSDLRTRNRS